MTVCGRLIVCIFWVVIAAGCDAGEPPRIVMPENFTLKPGQTVNDANWYQIDIRHSDRESVRCTSKGLPSGIQIDEGSSLCSLYGAPRISGVYESEITARSGSATSTKKVRWIVQGAAPASDTADPEFTNPTQLNQQFFVGEHISWLVIDVSDKNDEAVSCRASDVVAGLDFDQGSFYCAFYGRVSASPGTYNTSIIATNQSGRSTTAEIVFNVLEPKGRPKPVSEEVADAWYLSPLDGRKVHPDSEIMIKTLEKLGGFGHGRLQIDFGIVVNYASDTDPVKRIAPHPYGYYAPDCEPLGTELPVPDGALIEGRASLPNCNNEDQDCHYIARNGSMLYEIFQARENSAGDIEGLCLAVWDLSMVYPPTNRGEHCTSADAAGWPIEPLLFDSDEIAASLENDPAGSGDLGHAIRFILPNSRMASDEDLGGLGGRLYVRPASHAGAPSGPRESVPYGARLRLRSDFPMEGYNPAAKVLLNTMMRYGIALADGGSVSLTAEDDVFMQNSWGSLGIHSRTFDRTIGARPVRVRDFEVIDTGSRIAETYACRRSN